MAYKVSGVQTHDCNVKIFQGNEYVGYTSVSGGAHETIFDLTLSGVVTAIGEKPDGQIVGAGQVEPIYTASAANIITAGGGLSLASIQHITDYLYDSEETSNTTINSVDMDKTILLRTGYRVYQNQAWKTCYRHNLSSSTNIYTYRDERLDPAGGMEWNITVLEFSSGVKSVQRGVSAISGNTNITINSVDPDKCLISFLGTSDTGSSTFYGYRGNFKITSATNLNVNNIVGTSMSWEVLEFE